MAGEAVTVAKGKKGEGGEHMLSTGVRARLLPVSQSIIQDALALVEEPRVPTWKNPEKDGREEENPADPDYLKAMAEYHRELTFVTFDVMAMFGVELADGVPEDDAWLKRLKLAHKMGRLDLSKFDLEDEIDQEFLYKRYVALGNEDFVAISRRSGISGREVEQALDRFPGDEEREADPEGGAA